MILKHGDQVQYNCGNNPTKARVINLKNHELVAVRCACGPTRVFQCLPGTVKRSFTVNVPCNTTVIVFC